MINSSIHLHSLIGPFSSDLIESESSGLPMAAYIPPHKRHSKDDDDNRPLPTKFQMKVGTSKSRTKHSKDRNPKFRYLIKNMNCAIRKWFIEADDDQIPADSIQLEPFYDYEYMSLRSVLLSGRGIKNSSPWVSITERIRSELLASFANVRSAMDLGEAGAIMKPTFVARIGKVYFRNSSVNIRSSSRSEAETALAHVRKEFTTNAPDLHMEAILGGGAPKIIADFYQPKEYCRVDVFDKNDPESYISIKCQIMCGELKIQKIEKNQKRCFVADVSCLHKDLDLRLRLAIKRDLTRALKDDFEELKGLKGFVDSAILDGNVKGGLRWPLGKEHSSEGRYSVIGAWHTTVKTFKNSSLKLRIKHSDIFDFCNSDGEVENELTVDMKGINDMLIYGMVDMEPAIGSLEETLKLVWTHLLSFEL
ncbi:hypothetical protein MKX03_000094 [Papaver bracteatum]|nr:hypothetical protein MKX03_000094 [Papaver bracteatum]